MKILKNALLGVVGLVVLVLTVALFLKKDYAVERSVTIAKPRADVFAYLVMLKNQDNYSVWATADPAMKKEYRGVDGTVGFVSAWDSQERNVGKGEQEIKAIDDGRRIDYELRFIKPFESTEKAYLVTEDAPDGQTKVSWGFSGSMKYPMNLMLVFMNMEKMLAGDFEVGLSNLKMRLERQ